MNDYIENSINNLKDFAKSRGMKVVFRNHTTNCGDFCIFIYDSKMFGFHTRYLVGYDGSWDANHKQFDDCWEMAMDYIRKYK